MKEVLAQLNTRTVPVVPAKKSSYSVYDRAKANSQDATAPVAVHTVVNRLNRDTIPDLVAEWQKDTPVVITVVVSFQPL